MPNTHLSVPHSTPVPYTDHSGHIIPHVDDSHLHHELPAYTQNTKEFRYSLTTHASLELTLLADGSYSKTQPIYLQGVPIQGKVQLKLDHPDSFSKVLVTVNGFVVSGDNVIEANIDGARAAAGFKTNFLDQELTVWSHEGKAKLHGEYTWPFSIHLPEEVEIPVKGDGDHQSRKYQLPHTFSQREVETTVRYEISVKLVRDSIFKADETLTAPFVYIPITRPPALPASSRIAYEQGKPLSGPTADPDAWHLQKSIHVEGAFFDNHSASVEVKFFLAKPLSYTRGSFIPLFITLEGDDEKVLDLLSSPTAIVARVRREIGWTRGPESHRLYESSGPKKDVEHSQRAVWWPASQDSSGAPSKGTRSLNGELHLKHGMEPNCELPNYGIHYSVVLLQFDTPALATKSTLTSEVLLEQPINIVTSFAPGPRPKASTPAKYKPDAHDHAGEVPVVGLFSREFY